MKHMHISLRLIWVLHHHLREFFNAVIGRRSHGPLARISIPSFDL